MKRNWKSNILIFLILAAGTLTACKHKDDHAQALIFICPMHPTVISDKQGTCPVCGMDLVRQAAAGEELEIGEEINRLTSAPNSIILSDVKTIKGSFGSKSLTTQALGKIGYDTRNLRTIASRTSGRLERVYVKYLYQQVAKGQKLADLYSPELLTAQKELLYVISSDPDNQELIASAQRKLYLLGMGKHEVSALMRAKQPSPVVAIYSELSGYIVPDDGTSVPSPAMNTGGMQPLGETSTPPANGDLPAEGSYVTSGQSLFRLVDSKTLWLELDLPGSTPVKSGDKMSVDIHGQKFESRVDFIQPFFDDGVPFVRVRVFVPATGQMQVGQLVEATVSLGEREALWVPAHSVVDLGRDQVVFVREKNAFTPRVVLTGARTDDSIEIIRGLTSSEEIALHGNYLVDSDGFINVK